MPLEPQEPGYRLLDLLHRKSGMFLTRNRGLITEYAPVRTPHVGNEEGDDEGLGAWIIHEPPY